MVDCLLDTAVVADVLRKYPLALDWLSRQKNPGVTPTVWLEIIEGANDRTALNRAVRIGWGYSAGSSYFTT